MIIMSSITVTPSTSGRYGGKSQTLTFYPIIGFQYTTFHKGIDPKVRVIQCNMVNEDNLWSLKVIQSRWIEFILNRNFTPKLGQMASIFARVHRKLYWEPSWQSENRWRVEDDLFSLIVAWWRSSITQNTVHFCKARTSLELSGKSWCVHCADKVATGTLSQLTMDNGNEELETHNTGNTNTETEYTRSPLTGPHI